MIKNFNLTIPFHFSNLNVSKLAPMCPLRLILVFLSATLAGFFLLRNLKSQPHHVLDSDNDCNNTTNSSTQQPPATPFSKVRLTMESGFWTFVDMASGKYLWRHLVSSSPKRA